MSIEHKFLKGQRVKVWWLDPGDGVEANYDRRTDDDFPHRIIDDLNRICHVSNCAPIYNIQPSGRVHVPTPEISASVQRMLFEAGKSWKLGRATVQYTDNPYLFWYVRHLATSELGRAYFDNNAHPLHTLADFGLENVEGAELATADKVQEFRPGDRVMTKYHAVRRIVYITPDRQRAVLTMEDVEPSETDLVLDTMVPVQHLRPAPPATYEGFGGCFTADAKGVNLYGRPLNWSGYDQLTKEIADFRKKL